MVQDSLLAVQPAAMDGLSGIGGLIGGLSGGCPTPLPAQAAVTDDTSRGTMEAGRPQGRRRHHGRAMRGGWMPRTAAKYSIGGVGRGGSQGPKNPPARTRAHTAASASASRTARVRLIMLSFRVVFCTQPAPQRPSARTRLMQIRADQAARGDGARSRDDEASTMAIHRRLHQLLAPAASPGKMSGCMRWGGRPRPGALVCKNDLERHGRGRSGHAMEGRGGRRAGAVPCAGRGVGAPC
jgi:hypothetical protein